VSSLSLAVRPGGGLSVGIVRLQQRHWQCRMVRQWQLVRERVLKVVNLLLLITNIAVLAMGGWFIISRGYQAGNGWTPVELVTIILTALAVIVAVMGVFFAIMAIWGYSQIREDARLLSRKVAIDEVGKVVPRAIASELDRRVGADGYAEAASKDDGNA
jgi:hypothetical protein